MQKNKDYLARYSAPFLLILFSFGFGLIWSFGLSVNPFERLQRPIHFAGDGGGILAFIKAMIDGDWLPYSGIKSARLAAPFGFNFSDYPSTDGVFHSLFWLVSRFTSNPFHVLDVSWLLSFPLNAAAMYWLLRSNAVNRFLSVALSVLYTLLPFHFNRFNHIYYALYFTVPIAFGYLIRLWRRVQDESSPVFEWQDALFAIFFAGCGFYQSYFLMFQIALIFVCWVAPGKIDTRRLLKVCGLPVAFLLVSLMIYLIPTWVFWIQAGGNAGLSSRTTTDVELYGLKLINLFLPPVDSVIRPLAAASARYRSGTPVVEGFGETIGLFGFAGLTMLIVTFVRGEYKKTQLSYFLGLSALGMLLFATIGGYGSIFAQFGLARFRCLNRISIWIACLSYLFIGLQLQGQLAKRKTKGFRFGVVIALIFALLELAPRHGRFEAGPDPVSFNNDHDFFAALESKLPEGASVLQLPFVPFPEMPAVYGMSDYEHMRAMIFTQKLKFSYGSFKGRANTDLIRSLSEPSLDIERIKALGFRAIYIDTAGYPGGVFDLKPKVVGANDFREKLSSRDHRRIALIF